MSEKNHLYDQKDDMRKTVTGHLRDRHKLKGGIHGSNDELLSMLRRRIECDGGNASAEQLEALIDMYPKELAFSLLLCTTRFPVHSRILMKKIFQAIEDYSEEQMDYCIHEFQGDVKKKKNADTVIGEALTLIFSPFDDFVATPETGNLRALYLIKQRYPRSILYVDGHGFTPLHGVCCALNMDIFRFFINWHMEQPPKGRGGVYSMNNSGITPIDTLIDTQQDIVPQLKWLIRHKLLKFEDVNEWFLVHRSAHSSSRETIQLFITLYPSGVLAEDDGGNLPIHFHLSDLRDRPKDSFSDEDYAITKLLITKGLEYGGTDTIGGLFHPMPDEKKSCTLDALLKRVGEASHEKIWGMIDEWIEEVTEWGYDIEPIVLAALRNKEHMSEELFEYAMSRYVMLEDDDGNLPIHLYLDVRGWSGDRFTDEDYAITKLLITKGLEYGGVDTIGGLFHREPDEEKSCTLDALLREVGEASHEELWGMIDDWIKEATGGDYTLAPIVHTALQNKQHISAELFEYVMSRYATNESNEDGVSPLMYAVALGAKWDGCACHLLNKNLKELNSSESETELPILPFAASRNDPDISVLYEFARRSPWMFDG